MTFSITTLSLKGLNATLSIAMLCHYAERHYAECRVSFTIIMLDVVKLSVIMMSVIMLSVVRLTVMAPSSIPPTHFLEDRERERKKNIWSKFLAFPGLDNIYFDVKFPSLNRT
jgi:hypothetical protein